LEGQGALEKLAAVEAAAENKVAFEEGARIAKDLEDFVVSHVGLKLGGRQADEKRKSISPFQLGAFMHGRGMSAGKFKPGGTGREVCSGKCAKLEDCHMIHWLFG
jgi:hypothetical protein